MPTNTTIKHPTRTKQYRALFAALGDKDLALAAWKAHNEPAPKPTESLVVSLVKEPKAKKKAKKAKAAKVAVPQTPKEVVDALIESRGLSFARGRVYVTPEIVEASVRVLKGGNPEIIRTSGNGRVTYNTRNPNEIVKFRYTNSHDGFTLNEDELQRAGIEINDERPQAREAAHRDAAEEPRKAPGRALRSGASGTRVLHRQLLPA